VSERHIGVDEAGRGPAIGPLVVCALSIPKEDRIILKNMGVDDSKNLSKKRRKSIHSEIITISKSREWEIGIIRCSAGDIDRWMESGNLNTLEVMLFAEAISEVTNKTSEFTLFLDACDVDARRFGRNVSFALGERAGDFKIVSEHKMDASDVITGAASIIAKIHRDLAVDKLSKKWGVDLGSGYPSDTKSKNAIENLCREEYLPDFLRRKWSNVERAWAMHHRKPIPQREGGGPRSSQSALDEWN